MTQVVVVGAGVAGLTAGCVLAQAGMKVTVVEKESAVGGLARTFRYGPFWFDIGPKRFHTDDGHVLAFLKSVLGDDILTIPRSSGVYIYGRYHPWPLRPMSLFKLPLPVMLHAGLDLFRRPEATNQSLKDYVVSRYGATLYRIFFEPYTEKFLKLSPQAVHADWAQAGVDRSIIDPRIKMESLLDVARTTLLPRAVQTYFLYPASGGIDTFAQRLAQGIQASGGRVILNAQVSRLALSAESIAQVELENGEELAADLVVWTAPLPLLCPLLGLPPSDLRYLSTVFYNLEVEGMVQHPYQWCYFGQADTTFVRTSIPAAFNPKAAPPGQTGLCAEVTCFAGDEVWRRPETLTEALLIDLVKVGQIRRREQVQAVHIERVANTYPVYELHYRERVDKVITQCRRIENLHLLGRCATFWYNNMDHSIRAALNLCWELAPRRF